MTEGELRQIAFYPGDRRRQARRRAIGSLKSARTTHIGAWPWRSSQHKKMAVSAFRRRLAAEG